MNEFTKWENRRKIVSLTPCISLWPCKLWFFVCVRVFVFCKYHHKHDKKQRFAENIEGLNVELKDKYVNLQERCGVMEKSLNFSKKQHEAERATRKQGIGAGLQNIHVCVRVNVCLHACMCRKLK